MGKKDEKKDAAENIKVAVRLRPLNSRELEHGYKSCIDLDIGDGQVTVKTPTGQPDVWTFDYVFNHTFTQNDIFLQVIRPLIESTLDGYNSTIFAYGQSGSGKTHTMTGVLGDSLLEGITPRSFRYIFSKIKEAETGKFFKIHCSYVELYNGKCRDLLSDSAQSLNIREAPDKTFYVQDLCCPEVKFEDDLASKMEEGTDRRAVAGTDLNAHSSRSHSIFSVYLTQTSTTEDGDVKSVTSKLNLVDLAGSERQSKTGATGDTLKEGCNINLSLSALGTVIDTIVKGRGHVPFRSSPLTMLLKDSLGGGSKTIMFANIGPSEHNLSETVSTLRFADRAKQIKNKPKIQMDPKDQKIVELTQLVEELKAKLRKYEGGADEDAVQEEESLQEKMAQLEMDLENSSQFASRLEQEMKQEQARLNAQLKESEEKAQKLLADIEEAKQEALLADQKASDDRQQLRELQVMVHQFVLGLGSGNSPSLEDVANPQALQGILDTVRDNVDNAASSRGAVNPETLKLEIEKALLEQKESLELHTQQRELQYKNEIQRVTLLNEQAQVTLNESLNRMMKLKERIEKEKSKRKEEVDAAQKREDELVKKHRHDAEELQKLLQDAQSGNKAASIKLQESIMRRSRSITLNEGRDEQDDAHTRGHSHAAHDEGASGHEEVPEHDEMPSDTGGAESALGESPRNVAQDGERLSSDPRVEKREREKRKKESKEKKAPSSGGEGLFAFTKPEALQSELNSERESLLEQIADLEKEKDAALSASHQAIHERKELENEIENLRNDMMSEVNKNSELNQLHMKLMKDVELMNEKMADLNNEKLAIQNGKESSQRVVQELERKLEGLASIEERLKQKHEQDIKRLNVQLKEKTNTLENKIRVVQTQQEILEKKKEHERELENRVEELLGQLKDRELKFHEQLELQANRITQQNNKKIEEIIVGHQGDMKRLQSEIEKLKKKKLKMETAVSKVKERYDQECVRSHELLLELEKLKEQMLRKVTGQDADQAQQAREEIDKLLKRRNSLNERQKELLGKHGIKSNQNADVAARFEEHLRGPPDRPNTRTPNQMCNTDVKSFGTGVINVVNTQLGEEWPGATAKKSKRFAL